MTTKKTLVRRALSLLLTLLMVLSLVPVSIISAYAAEEPKLNDDGYYEIETYEDLCWYRDQVNADRIDINAILMNDIVVNENVLDDEGNLNDGTFLKWEGIGDNFNGPTLVGFYGIFDGNGKTISGIYTDFSNGSFIRQNYGVIKNLNIVDSYFGGASFCGNYNYGSIINCSSSATIYNTSISMGGICQTNDGLVENCTFTGKIITSTSDSWYVGGICARNYSTILNCYSSADVSGYSGLGGISGPNNGTVENCCSTGNVTISSTSMGRVCYGVADGTVINSYYINTSMDSGSNAIAVSQDQLESGEVAYLLQGTQTDEIWGQKIGTDTAPVLGGDKVYYGYTSCADDATEVYTNNSNATADKHVSNFINGFCTDCGVFEPATDENEDGVFEIGNAGQLYWFAKYVNAGNTSANAELTADIVVNEGVMTEDTKGAREWTPIGSDSNRYKGAFEGNGHTVSGLYFSDIEAMDIGLIGCADKNSTVNNIGVLNSYFSGDQRIGSIVGALRYSSASNCYSSNCSFGADYGEVGGLFGFVRETTITDCYNESDVKTNSYYNGGIFGSSYYEITVKNCYNTGDIDGDYAGGIAGHSRKGVFENCYNTGAVGSATTGGIVGDSDTDTIIKCYNLGAITCCTEARPSMDTHMCEVGGICGYSEESNILNCYNCGNITGARMVGGIAGYIAYGGKIANCFNIAKVVGHNNVRVGSICGIQSGSPSISDCYYLAGTHSLGIGESSSAVTNVEEMSSEQFASGEVAYLLQGEQTEQIWGQKIGTDELPVLDGDKVYYGYTSCADNATAVYTNDSSVTAEKPAHKEFRAEFTWDKPYDGECYVSVELYCTDCGGYVDSGSSYATLKETVEAEDCMHPGSELYEVTFEYEGVTYTDTKEFCVKSDNHTGEFVNGFCTDCSGFEPAKYNEETGVYEISNSGQLYWYAQKLNEENAEIYAKLMNDIIIPDDAPNWTPINCSNAYFDGNFKTISGLMCVDTDADYVGLFGCEGWWYEISNLHITDSYFEGKDYVGAVVACMTNGGSVTNCYVTNTTVKGDSDNVGTLVGDMVLGNIINCYVDTDNLVGYYNDSYATVENSYYLADTDDGNGGKTLEQFASGEVAYLLQGEQEEEIWGQNIGTDAYPVLGGDKVYMKTDAEGNTVYYNEAVEEKTDKLAGYTISLGDKIAVNYYMRLTEKTLNDANAKMVFTVPDTGATYTLEIPVSSVTPNKDGYYVFTCEVAAKEMTSTISAKLVTSEGELVLDDYTVQEYAEVILSDTVKYAKEQKLVKKMLNYGAQAQIYFNYNTDNLANDTEYMTEEEKVTELYGFAGAPFTLEGEESGVTYYGTALSLETELAFKHYFIIDESVDIESLEITCDYPATLKKNGSFYELIISDIPAHKMGENSLKVVFGGITLDYTIYSYGALAQNAGKEALWTVVSALAHFAGEATMYAYK